MTPTALTLRTQAGLTLCSLLALHSLTGISACSTPDADGDGYSETDDCNDQDANTYPGATELCDGQDNNCDGVPEILQTWHRDRDLDTWGDTSGTLSTCDGSQPAGYILTGGDCNDLDATTHPEAVERCDKKDHDCDGNIPAMLSWYRDDDGDGVGVTASLLSTCLASPPMGYVATPGDCNDTDPNLSPWQPDTCDGLDNDCDGTLDEDKLAWYLDADHDLFGDKFQVEYSCTPLTGYVSNAQDCDDADDSIHPGALELCDTVDRDCSGSTRYASVTLYPDRDQDGYGNADAGTKDCTLADGYVTLGGDCRDTDASRHPQAIELCDRIDNDCSGVADDTAYYSDLDHDGFGVEGSSATCTGTTSVVPARGDCNDGNATFHPGATDTSGDGIDSDCGGSQGPDPSVGLGPSSSPGLMEALAAAAPGTTVWVGPGRYIVSDLTFAGKPLTLKSTHDARTTALDALWRGRHFSFTSGEGSSTRLVGFLLTRGQVDGRGGSLLIDGSSPSIQDCIFQGNTARGALGRGGALALVSSSAVLSNLTFEDNQAGGCFEGSNTSSSTDPYNGGTNEYASSYRVCTPGMGGALSAEASTLSLDALVLSRNVATGAGGALALQGGTLTLTGLQLEDNRAEAMCVQMHKESSTHDISTTTSIADTLYCPSAAQGGALYASGTTLTLQGNQLRRNKAPATCGDVGHSSSVSDLYALDETGLTRTSCAWGQGGGVYLEQSTTLAQNETLENNRASLGGGFYVLGGSFSLATSQLVQQQAESQELTTQDVAYYEYWDLATEEYAVQRGHQLVHTRVQGGEGAGLWLDQTEARLQGVTIAQGIASQLGGALVASSAQVEGSNLLLEDNSSPGAVATSTTWLEQWEITEETVYGGRGGAVATTAGTLTLDHARVTGNQAIHAGGLALQGQAQLKNVLVAENSALGAVDLRTSPDAQVEYGLTGGQGGGIRLQDAGLSLTQSVLALNAAEAVSSPSGDDVMNGLGGGLFLQLAGGDSVAITGSILSHNTGVGLYAASGVPVLTDSALSAPAGETAHNLGALDSSVWTGDPGYLSVNAAGEPIDFHLSTASACINRGPSGQTDRDGSRSDIGLYGGAEGDRFNLDGDALPDWFWPGTRAQPPAGFSSSAYDCNDLNSQTTSCP